MLRSDGWTDWTYEEYQLPCVKVSQKGLPDHIAFSFKHRQFIFSSLTLFLSSFQSCSLFCFCNHRHMGTTSAAPTHWLTVDLEKVCVLVLLEASEDSKLCAESLSSNLHCMYFNKNALAESWSLSTNQHDLLSTRMNYLSAGVQGRNFFYTRFFIYFSFLFLDLLWYVGCEKNEMWSTKSCSVMYEMKHVDCLLEKGFIFVHNCSQSLVPFCLPYIRHRIPLLCWW